MPYKRPPTDAEISALAAEFRAVWISKSPVRVWLRKHHTRFGELITEGWSWAGIAAALNEANITYQTGNPWTGDRLRAHVFRAVKDTPKVHGLIAPRVPAERAASSRRAGEAAGPSPLPGSPTPIAWSPPRPAQRMAEDEFDRLDEKYGFQGKVKRRARQLRGETVLPFTPEEEKEQKAYMDEKRRFNHFRRGGIKDPFEDHFERDADAQIRHEEHLEYLHRL